MEIEIMSEKEDPKLDEYAVKDGLRTLMQACEIQANKPLMAKIKEMAGKQKKHITSIADLKDAYAEKTAPKEEGAEDSMEPPAPKMKAKKA